jgi:small GTP-binding protein
MSLKKKNINNDLKSNDCKVVLLGGSAVGKTSIITRFVSSTFNENHSATIGGYFINKEIFIEKYNIDIKLNIWDTAGQERYRSLTKFFYKDAKIIILTYDITRPETFVELKDYWFDQLKNIAMDNIVIGIAGNKFDLIEEEKVSEEEVREYAKEIDASFRFTSALNNNGIDELFKELVEKYIEKFGIESLINKDLSIKLSNKMVKKKKKCCKNS